STKGPRINRGATNLFQPRVAVMESERKRSRPVEDRQVALQAWCRLFLKLIFVLSRVNEMAFRLLRPRRLADQDTRGYTSPGRMTTASSRTPPRASSSGMRDDFEVISMTSGRTGLGVNSVASSQASAVIGQDLVTDQVLRLVGPPLRCDHQETTKLFVCRKQGPNYKRLFWRCPRPRGNQCSTFVWRETQPYLDPIYQNDLEPEDYAPTISSQESKTPVENIIQELQRQCPHTKTDKRGTNPYKIVVKCATCGKLLKSEVTELGKQKEIERRQKEVEPTYQDYLEWKRSGACQARGVWSDPGTATSSNSKKK
ncbi:unnamed protein product, partial [Durusdinium trenchii]